MSFPAAAALALALIYGLGAFAWSVELSRGGVPVRVAFMAIPVLGNLARGLQIVVQPKFLIAAVAVILVAGLISLKPTKSGPSRRTLIGLLVGGALAALIGAPVVLGTVIVANGIAAALLMMMVDEGRRRDLLRRPVHLSRAAAVIVFLVTLAVVGLEWEAISPSPLPRVTLTRWSGGVTRGLLIVATDTAWYLGEPHQRVVVVPADDVSQASISQSRRRHILLDENIVQLFHYGGS